MASDKSFVDFVVDQIQEAGEVSSRMMFGEYVVYVNKKVVALICDNKLFVKPTTGGRKFIHDVVEAPPYEGAKNCFLIEDKVDDSEWLTQLIKISHEELPEPKPKKKKKKK